MTFDPTPNLGLKKIDYGSAAWDADEHANADKIDAAAMRVVFAARLSAAQSIPSDISVHRVAFNSIVYDPLGFWNGTWPIVPVGMAGSYLVACSFEWAPNGSGARSLDIGTDSSQDPDGGLWLTPPAPAPYPTAATGSWVSLGNQAGFGFYTQVSQNSGGALNLNYCTLTLSRLLP